MAQIFNELKSHPVIRWWAEQLWRYRATTKSHEIKSWKSISREACAKRGGRGALFASSVSLKKGGVERKLSLGLVRSFFALSIGDNILSFSLPCLGGYHWLRTRRLLRLQKANSSLAPLPLRFAAFSSRSTGREKPIRPYGTGQRTCRAECDLVCIEVVSPTRRASGI